MKNWYENKIEFHRKQLELAQDSGKEKAAAFHKAEIKNYKEMCDRVN